MTPHQAVLLAYRNRRRMPELEPLILTDVMSVIFYVKRIIKIRWPKAEPILQQEPHYWKEYTSFLKYNNFKRMFERYYGSFYSTIGFTFLKDSFVSSH